MFSYRVCLDLSGCGTFSDFVFLMGSTESKDTIPSFIWPSGKIQDLTI